METTDQIKINYKTGIYTVDFTLRFGEGIPSSIEPDCKKRKNISSYYDVQVVESGEGDSYTKGYVVIGNEGPLVVQVSDIKITPDTNDSLEYAIGLVFDLKEPLYKCESDITPYNIKRDGTMWCVEANKGETQTFDQNGNAMFQLVMKRALDLGQEPTEKEKEMGVEMTTQETGMLYISFMVLSRDTIVRTRGVGSAPARLGYGDEAKTKSEISDFKYTRNTERFILPIRYRVNDGSSSDVNCAKDLESAIHVSRLKKMTVRVPLE